jgi:O-antigen ligase
VLAPTTGFGWIDSWHNEQRAVQILLLALSAVGFCLAASLNGQLAGKLTHPYVLSFFGLGVASSLGATYRFAAFAELSLWFLLLVLALTAHAFFAVDTERRLRWLRLFATLLGAAYTVGVAVRYGAAVELHKPFDVTIFLLGYANPRFPSALHALLLPFIAALAIDNSERTAIRSAAFVVLSCLVAINLGLGTRAIWFAYAVALPVVIGLIGWQRTRPFAIVLGSATLIGLAIYWVLFKYVGSATGMGEEVGAPTKNLTLTHRDVLWALSLEAIRAAPWLGVGPMNFAAISNRVGAHPHNWILQFAAEWGIPALLIGCAAIAHFLRRHTGWVGSLPSGAGAITLLVALSFGLVDGSLVMPVSQTAAAILAGTLCYRSAETALARQHLAQARLGWAIAGPLSCTLVLSAYAVLSFSHQTETARTFQRTFPGAWATPRLWEHGQPISSLLDPVGSPTN